ncbi:NusA-like transcription termination signal-binding factor [Halolamina salifodinae]|uniref:Probable transcription termination protein NusA n=1 Tax=Halolamina salifodinae TaxID=1202767 RepID=A0A8T4GX69_9EURY|nr:NusA-like transcription termination signal-binding factor [Halolamina salifodinae]MBP1985915.1 N utilization substance protein A [Halolamina salifodinae]
MTLTLSDEARRYIAAFADATGVTPVDCLVEDDRAVFVVPAGEMGAAIGPGGQTVEEVEEQLDTRVDLVEDADDPAAFVANCLAPAAVRNVTLSTQGGSTVAYVEVAQADRGVAIGAGGESIETARRLADRHFDIDDVQLA